MIQSSLVAVLSLTLGSSAFAQHASDPIVLRGADLPALVGADVDRVVAFHIDGAWTQIPFRSTSV